MKFETSAGGIVYKIERGKIYFLLIRDQNGFWTFPKGLIEKGEDKILTAKREVKEEVGLAKIKFEAEIDKIEYFYKFGGELIKKRVYYFLFSFSNKEPLRPQKEEGINQAKFFLEDEALNNIGYRKTNEKVLNKAIKILKNGMV